MNDPLASCFEAASRSAGALAQLYDGSNAPDAGACATKARQAANDLLFAASEANAQAAMQKLNAVAGNERRLTALTAHMAAAAQRIAVEQKDVAKVVSVASEATKLAAAVTCIPPNVDAGMKAVGGLLGTLGIAG